MREIVREPAHVTQARFRRDGAWIASGTEYERSLFALLTCPAFARRLLCPPHEHRSKYWPSRSSLRGRRTHT